MTITDTNSGGINRRTALASALMATTAGISMSGTLIPTNAKAQSPASPMRLPAGVKVGQLEVVADLGKMRPALVTIDSKGRLFATVHFFDRKEPQLIRITGRNTWEPWPNAQWNRGFGAGPDSFDQPLGILVDGKDRVWTVDCGQWPPVKDGGVQHQPRSPRVLAFDAETGRNLFNIVLPTDICPAGTYPQDIAVDDQNGFVYLADIGGSRKPAIVVVNINNGQVRRLEGHASLEAEDVNLMVEGKVAVFPDATGKFVPARIGINPITLSADNNTIFYGPMCGLGWYSLDARLVRSGAADAQVFGSVRRIANKPVCDGVATDTEGNHFLTNLVENAIDKIDANGVLTRLVGDDRLIWADGVRFGADGWLYVSVNHLNRSPLFTGDKDLGEPPYTIMRVNTGTRGLVGR
jgi:DNA-binding beta-propeller fold protein YncE